MDLFCTKNNAPSKTGEGALPEGRPQALPEVLKFATAEVKREAHAALTRSSCPDLFHPVEHFTLGIEEQDAPWENGQLLSAIVAPVALR
jgi:hypothetical protein